IGLLHQPAVRREEHVPAFLELAYGKERRELLLRLEAEQVGDAPAARGATRLRDLVYLQPEDFPARGEDQQVRVRRGDEEVLDEVCIAGTRSDLPASASPLRAIERDGVPLDVALVRD